MREAAAYYRTSSAANVGEDKDSLSRQQDAVRSYAAANGLRITQEAYDAAVSGSDPIDQRPGFSGLLSAANPVSVILVESATRFARDLAVQLTGHDLLKEMDIDLIPVDAPDYFLDETPTAVMVRQILGAVSEFQSATIKLYLRRGRNKKRNRDGKCGGMPGYRDTNPNLVRHAKRLRRKSPKTGKRRSLNSVSQELFALGFKTSKGNAFSASQVQRLVG